MTTTRDGDIVGRLFFPNWMLDQVAARNDPKCPPGWHVKYAERVIRDIKELRPWLPGPLTSILDIGCGFAGIDVLLAYEGVVEKIYLIDGAAHGVRQAGFQKATVPWNDVHLAAQFVQSNISGDIIALTVPPPPPSSPVDLVISLKSWGHHYPVGSYLAFVRESLRPGGTVILDIRKNSSGRAQLEAAGFRFRGRAGGTLKTDRLVFQGPA